MRCFRCFSSVSPGPRWRRRRGTDPPDTNALGNAIADAILASTDADFALHNFLGQRGDILRGEINDTILGRVLPFRTNRILVVRMSGARLAQVIGFAEAAGRAWCIAGGRATLQPPAPGDAWAPAEVVDARGNPLEPEQAYRVAFSPYLYDLAAYYGPLDGEIVAIGDTVHNVVRRYLEEAGELHPDRAPRIIRPPGTTRDTPFR